MFLILTSHIVCKYFFPFLIGCLFTLLIVSSAVQELFSILESQLFIFYFVAWGSAVISKK